MRKGKSIILVLVFLDAKLTPGNTNVRVAALIHVCAQVCMVVP